MPFMGTSTLNWHLWHHQEQNVYSNQHDARHGDYSYQQHSLHPLFCTTGATKSLWKTQELNELWTWKLFIIIPHYWLSHQWTELLLQQKNLCNPYNHKSNQHINGIAGNPIYMHNLEQQHPNTTNKWWSHLLRQPTPIDCHIVPTKPNAQLLEKCIPPIEHQIVPTKPKTSPPPDAHAPTW